jgi:hypothetical protein
MLLSREILLIVHRLMKHSDDHNQTSIFHSVDEQVSSNGAR